MAETAGSLVAGRYRIVELLGEGAMGAVWRAHDEQLRRDVALKQIKLPSDMGAQVRAQRVRWVQREARAAGKLRHHGIVTVYDQFQDEDDLPWIVMEYVPGLSLHRTVQEDGRLSPERACGVP